MIARGNDFLILADNRIHVGNMKTCLPAKYPEVVAGAGSPGQLPTPAPTDPDLPN
jgi:hypothetical protein